MNEYVEAGKKMYLNFKEALKDSKSIKEAADKCDYELYHFDEWLEAPDEVIVNMNLTEEALIGVVVNVNYITGEMELQSHCEIVDPETDDWDGEKYQF